MPHKPKAHVLDSWAILSFFHDEPAAEKVETLIGGERYPHLERDSSKPHVLTEVIKSRAR